MAGALLAGCSGTMGDDAHTSKDGVDASEFGGGGKADFGKSAKMIDDIALDTTVEGEFDPRVRSYGYSFEAKKGANLKIELTATAGADARGLDEGATLDTTMALYKNYEGPGEVGEKLKETDDSESSLAAPSIELQIEETGKYFLAFTSYHDTGKGSYTLDLTCDGTDFQCQRPDYEKPCEKEEKYIRGGTIEEDTTWSACDIILLETVTVAEGAILTLRPGVTVKGNFIRESDQQFFGNVTLDVNGTLQAGGTEEHPIAFTAYKDRGWGGVVLRGDNHTVEHVFVDRAGTGFNLKGVSNAKIRHAVIEGIARFEGEERRGDVGIQADADSQAEFTHSLVKGYERGVHTTDNEGLVVRDSVIRNNKTGVYLQGQSDLGDRDIKRCRRESHVDRHRDPVFKHVDILENVRHGINIEGDNIFLQLEKSNLINNGRAGLRLFGTQLADESFLNQNNIYGNNGQSDEEAAVQILTYHRNTVELEKNYWGFISDPQLENSWSIKCDEQGGEISFTGFAPEPIADAGPRQDEIRKEVKQQSWQQTQQGG